MLGARHFDVCVIGSGIAGALAAYRLAAAGRSVVILEAGKRFNSGERLTQLSQHQILRTPLWPWEADGRDGFVDDSQSAIGYSYRLNRSRVKAVGGSTLRWGGLINRYWESDFRTASMYGHGMDWPISYADIESYYCEAEAEIGVAGIQNPSDPPRSRPLPMGPFPAKFGEDEWFSVAERMGIEIGYSSHARNSAPYDGRPACAAFSVCPICPIGARYGADIHVDKALETGSATLFENTVARRILTQTSGEVSGVLATTMDGEDVEVSADNYILAAHSVESARLLLLSEIANSSDQVGRNLMEHWYTGAGGFVESSVYPYRIGFETLECNHWYDGPARRDRGAIKLSFIDRRDPIQIGLREGLLGTDLAQKDCEEFGRWVGVAAEIEHQPNPDSRVTLSESEVDQFGDPVPHVRFAINDVDRKTNAAALDIIQSLLEERGCRDIEAIPEFVRAHHHMGTCRMSNDPTQGVVDADCKVHGSNNLFVAGSSVFPTSGGRQPTLTLAALSLRLADHLLKAA